METANSRLKAVRPVAHLMVAAFLHYAGYMVLFPFLVDILLDAICPGKNECSQVILLMGALQLVVGLGTVVMAPILGGLSDDYGRKPVFVTVFFVGAIPQVLLAYKRTKIVVYIWFMLMMVAATLREAGLIPTALASVADVVTEDQRSSAVGLTMASITSGFLLGTLAAFVIKTTDEALWMTAILQILSVLYMKVFVKETNPRGFVLPANQSQSESSRRLLSKPAFKRQTTNLQEAARTVWSSGRLVTIALVDFMNSLATTGLQSFALYFLKATFNYGKNEFAQIMLLASLGAAVGQMVIYPELSRLVGEHRALWVGLLFSAAHYFVYGLAWASWVPYLACGMTVFSSFISPAVGTMVSRGVNRNQQGKVQGFMGGVRSLAAIVAPLVLTPLTAAALGDNPPLHLRGLPFVVCGTAMMGACLISLGLPSPPPPEHSLKPTDYIQAPLPPEDFIHVTSPPEDLLHVPIHSEVVNVINSEDNDENIVASQPE